MNLSLAKLIHDYQLAVHEAVKLIVDSGIQKPSTPAEWVENDIPQVGKLKHGIKYFKHGFGCVVHLPSGKVDFDFGAEGQIDGFDLWRLTGFATDRLKEYGFLTEADLKEAFSHEIKAGNIVQSDYILCYRANESA
ncbi:hypothetical protein [Methylophilus sp. Leaf414]|uniref:DUF6896 domain-containing protein n=1 Tax=Methylophilus sp. Leaf414 TaxID=1736371 RepID=UPI0006FCFDA2|nr:hypothetical protein [Methylophilus sp. Leaf414]KQT36002.1 hypothetical protein ASG24_06910 [Methylophilus sp. Leaf414]